MKIGDGMVAIFNLGNKKKVKVFHELSSNDQNAIRRKYKKECYREYRYSINLYILYVILGILSLIGLVLCLFNLLWGMVLFTLSFILMIINIYFLSKSNDNFYKYLNKNGYFYDKKKRN